MPCPHVSVIIVLPWEALITLGGVFASSDITKIPSGLLDCLWVLGFAVTRKIIAVFKSSTAIVTLIWP
jgi:hypothetical protein